MSVLRSLESKIAGLVEGTFSRVFSSEVRPVELARKLAREMEEHKSFSVSRTYVPNEYRIYLSPRDRERFAGYEEALADELAAYLLEHARRERLALVSRPVIEFETDAASARRVRDPDRCRQPEPEVGEDAAPRPGRIGTHGRLRHRRRPRESCRRRTVEARRPRLAHRAVLLIGGRRLLVGQPGATLGRSRQCDVVVDDPNVSRQHAEVRPERRGAGCSSISGRRTARCSTAGGSSARRRSTPGDEIEIGHVHDHLRRGVRRQCSDPSRSD